MQGLQRPEAGGEPAVRDLRRAGGGGAWGVAPGRRARPAQQHPRGHAAQRGTHLPVGQALRTAAHGHPLVTSDNQGPSFGITAVTLGLFVLF